MAQLSAFFCTVARSGAFPSFVVILSHRQVLQTIYEALASQHRAAMPSVLQLGTSRPILITASSGNAQRRHSSSSQLAAAQQQQHPVAAWRQQQQQWWRRRQVQLGALPAAAMASAAASGLAGCPAALAAAADAAAGPAQQQAALQQLQLVAELSAGLDSHTAGSLALVLKPALSLASLLMIVRIVMSWYPEIDGKAMPWAIAYTPTGERCGCGGGAVRWTAGAGGAAGAGAGAGTDPHYTRELYKRMHSLVYLPRPLSPCRAAAGGHAARRAAFQRPRRLAHRVGRAAEPRGRGAHGPTRHPVAHRAQGPVMRTRARAAQWRRRSGGWPLGRRALGVERVFQTLCPVDF